jgi:hypothetical protein
MKEKQNINRKRRVEITEEEINSRRKLVDWMCEIGDSIKLSPECIHKAVVYMDVITSENVVAEEHAQPVAIICMLIASKLIAKDCDIEHVISLFKRKMNNPGVEIMKYEMQVMTLLHWDMQCVTPMDFVQVFVSQGVLFSNDTVLNTTGMVGEQIARSLRQYSEFFADLCLQEHGLLHIESLHMAAAIIAASRKALKLTREWCRELEALTTLAYQDIEADVNLIMRY